ncbi:MAG: DUF4476 domain-containing protein, partial [Sphingobacteriales bacterium]
MPKIKEPQISFVIGFPKNLYPEQSFTISFAGNKDAGFLLKDFGSKGWGLYDLQSLAVVYALSDAQNMDAKEDAAKTPVINPPKVEETRNPFGDLLVQVTQDSTIRNTTVEKPKESVAIKKEEAVKAVVDTVKMEVKVDKKPVVQNVKNEVKPIITKTEPVATIKKDSVQTETKVEAKQPVIPAKEEPKPEIKPEVRPQETVIEKIESIKSTINLFATNENAEGWDYIYIDEEKTGKKDTISVFIAKEKLEIKPVIKTEPEIKDTVKKEVTEQPKFIEIIADTAKKEMITPVIEPIQKDSIKEIIIPIIEPIKKDSIVKESPKEAIKQEEPVVKTQTEPLLQKETVNGSSKSGIVNTDCKTLATDKDFITLRKRMAAEENDDDMVTAARKVFKTRCFTSEQVKNLCVLFLKDNGKYKFLDAAYPYVYDIDNFKQLGSLLTEEYYINRFKAMIKN